MKLERTKNAGKGMAFEVLKNFNGIILSFVSRTAMIYCLGIEYTGLGGLFTSILNVLNLAELGVGTAMIYSMYKPIAEDDEVKLCALINLYRKYLRIIGGVILGLGLCLMPFLDKLISGSVPDDINIYILFLMNLSVTVCSYWLFAYKTCILLAHQKNYVTERIDVVLNLIFSVLQILTLITLKNYYAYFGLELVRQVCSNLIKAYAAKKRYPQYKAKGTLDKSEEKGIRKKVKDIFTSRIGEVITGYADTIVISAFLGLTLLAQYQNYFYIFTAVTGVVGVIYNSTRAGIGNSLVTEPKSKNMRDINIFTLLIFWISTVCVSGFICLYQPFIKVWVHKENMLPFEIVMCLSVMFIVQQYRRVLETYRVAGGSWHYDRFRPLIAGLVNLALNLIMIQYIGLYGVVLSTIISEVVVSIPWVIINVYKNVFEASAKNFVFFTLKCTLISAVIMTLLCIISIKLPIDGIPFIIVRLIIGFVVSNIIYFVLFFKTDEFKGCISLAKKLISR